jgi:hypothetical protein
MIFVDVPQHRRFVCTKCGSRNVKVMPIFPPDEGHRVVEGSHPAAESGGALSRRLSRRNVPSGRAVGPTDSYRGLAMMHRRRRPVDALYRGGATKFGPHQAKPIDGIRAGLRAIYEPEDLHSEKLRTLLQMLSKAGRAKE